jgi:hypothetical protein
VKVDGSGLQSMASGWRRWRGKASQHTLFVQHGGVWDWAPTSQGRSVDAAPEHHHTLGAWVESHPGQRARLILSSQLLHHLVLNESRLPLHDETAISDYARHQFTHYHGSVAQGWPLAVWDDDRQRGVCALHGLDLSELLAQAVRCKVRFSSMTPWWAVALRVAQRQDPGLGRAAQAGLLLAEGQLLTCLTLGHGRLLNIEHRRLDEASLAAANDGAREWQAELAERADIGLTLTGYGLSVASTQPGALAPLRVLGDVDLLESARPHLQWVLA